MLDKQKMKKTDKKKSDKSFLVHPRKLSLIEDNQNLQEIDNKKETDLDELSSSSSDGSPPMARNRLFSSAVPFLSNTSSKKSTFRIGARTSPSTKTPQLIRYDTNLENDTPLGLKKVSISLTPTLYAKGFCVTETEVEEIAAGKSHFLLRTKDGSCYSWGYGFYGSLGHGNTVSLNEPKKIMDLPKVSKISAKGFLSAGLSSGVLYIWGNPGCAFMNNMKQFEIPVSLTVTDKVGTIFEFKNVALGASHAVLLTPNNEVITIGSNKFGMLGRGTKATEEWDNEAIIILTNIASIASSNFTSAVVSNEKKVYIWGKHLYTNDTTSEEFIAKPTRVKLAGGQKAANVAVGDTQLLVLTEYGDVFSMGTGAAVGHDKQISAAKSPFICFPIKSIEEEKDQNKETPNKNANQQNKKKKKNDRNTVKKLKELPQKDVALNVFCNNSVSFFISKNGSVFVWGSIEKNKEISEPTLLKGIEKELQAKQILFSNKQILITIGLHNTKTLKFVSYHPLIIQCGTFDKLFDWLFDPRCNHEYQNAFRKTYRSFTTPKALIEKLTQKFRVATLSNATNQQTLVIEFLKEWLKMRCKALDEFDDNQIFQQMKKLIDSIQEYSPKASEFLLLSLSKETKSPSPFPSPPNKSDWVTEVFMETPSYDIALHMCLVDRSMLTNVHFTEFENLNWMKKENKEKLAPNLIRLSSRFNNLTMWATTVIVSGVDKKERSLRLNKFTEILEHLVDLNNWASARAIHGAVNSVPVLKLKKRELISIKEKFEETISNFNLFFAVNNKRYREIVKNRVSNNKECIPFMGIHLSDITFIEDGNPDFVKFGETELINFYKRFLWTQQIAMIEKLQITSNNYSSFPLTRIESLENNLFYVAGRSVEELDQMVEKIIQGTEHSTSANDLSILASVAPVSFGTATTTEAFARRLEQQIAFSKGNNRYKVWSDWIEQLRTNLKFTITDAEIKPPTDSSEDFRELRELSITESSENSEKKLVSYREMFISCGALEALVENVVLDFPDKLGAYLLQKVLAVAVDLPETEATLIVEFLRVCNLSDFVGKDKKKIDIVSSLISALKNHDSLFSKEKIRIPRKIPLINSYNLDKVIDLLDQSWAPIWNYLDSPSRTKQIEPLKWAFDKQEWEKIRSLFDNVNLEATQKKTKCTDEILRLDLEKTKLFFTGLSTSEHNEQAQESHFNEFEILQEKLVKLTEQQKMIEEKIAALQKELQVVISDKKEIEAKLFVGNNDKQLPSPVKEKVNSVVQQIEITKQKLTEVDRVPSLLERFENGLLLPAKNVLENSLFSSHAELKMRDSYFLTLKSVLNCILECAEKSSIANDLSEVTNESAFVIDNKVIEKAFNLAKLVKGENETKIVQNLIEQIQFKFANKDTASSVEIQEKILPDKDISNVELELRPSIPELAEKNLCELQIEN